MHQVRYIITAVGSNAGHLSTTLFLGVLLLYMLAIFGWVNWPGEYGTSDKRYLAGSNLFLWVLDHLDYGMRRCPFPALLHFYLFASR